MKDFIIDIVLPIAAVISLIWLQIVFSNHKNSKMGYLLPGVFLGMSLLWFLLVITMALPTLNADPNNTVTVVDFLKILAVINIPTVVFFSIDFVVKRINRRKRL
ncbi:hypothetical protein G7062_11040 [Erysipelothrix sp. HDW6C]|uniref:hypothetical protein n=1 Tax=Erysipelothrix sp. HDW6C TaxID=2714930 RepID=UPI00140DF77B|nr:hypothetical protein [Erysipelothrix sp. HDW6C]QIK70795.1 hypothetical protein G7062_11040 [Erysipelothrix sp. HDW6C]